MLEIQPGVESFSDAVLQLMRKGVSALQNVQLLKWCRELCLTAYWNVLWGFPESKRRITRAWRVSSPILCTCNHRAALRAFVWTASAPTFFDATKMGFVDVSPLPAYRHVYPLEDEALMNLAYHFTFRYADNRDVNAYIRPLLVELRRWMSTHDAGLFMVDGDGRLAIGDLRPASIAPLSVLSGLARFLYLECDAIRLSRP